jgi:chromosome segregation ATPase
MFASVNNLCAQQSASHVTKKNFKKLSEQYDELQKNIRELEQQRSLLEKSLKDYDLKLRTFTENLGKHEQQFDEALPESDADQRLASTRQADAMRMAYNLQYLQMQNQLQNQTGQLKELDDFMKTKLEAIQKNVRKSK